MGRRQPISNKQRKAQLQEKRAIKRGDIDPPPDKDKPPRRNNRGGGRSQNALRLASRSDDPTIAATSRNAAAKIENSRKLQSAFRKLTPEFIAAWREKAAGDVLIRPVPEHAIRIPRSLVEREEARDLSTPKRPKWRFEMSKKGGGEE